MADSETSYIDMERMASNIPIGADGLRILPFGNGSERMLSNSNPGAQINNLQFNKHTRAHFYRAGLEGIAFAFVHGFQVLKDLGMDAKVIKVGNDNLFQSKIFSMTIANLLGVNVELIKTTGAAGAAKASGIGVGVYCNLEEAIKTNEIEHIYKPESSNEEFRKAYDIWELDLTRLLSNHLL